MGDGLRWQERQKMTEALSEELARMQEAVEEGPAARGRFHEQARDLLAEVHEGELVDWVTIAVYRHPDGSTTTSIEGEPERSDLQIKGLLHDALWTAAHKS